MTNLYKTDNVNETISTIKQLKTNLSIASKEIQKLSDENIKMHDLLEVNSQGDIINQLTILEKKYNNIDDDH